MFVIRTTVARRVSGWIGLRDINAFEDGSVSGET